MSIFAFSDIYYFVGGAVVGALVGPEINGPLWGSVISFAFGKLIHLGPGLVRHN